MTEDPGKNGTGVGLSGSRNDVEQNHDNGEVSKKATSEAQWRYMEEIGWHLSQSDTLEKILTKSLATSAGVVEADIMCLFQINESSSSLQPVAALGINPLTIDPLQIPQGQNPLAWVGENGKRIFKHDYRLMCRQEGEIKPSRGLLICFPLVFQNKTVGFLTTARRDTRAPFDKFAHSFLRTVATLFALAIKSGMPRDDLLYRERMEQALQYAHTLQRSFTPETLPDIEGYRLTVKQFSSLDMGGDFHDVVELTGGRFALMVGKTSGRGMDAGLNITRTVCDIRGILASGKSASKVLEILNRKLVSQKMGGLLVNLSLFIFDPSTGEMDFSGAGSNNVCLLSKTKNTLEHIDNGSAAPLGILSEWQFSESHHMLEKGDSIFAHTDGIVHCVNDNGESISRMKLENSLIQSLQSDRSASDLVMEAIREHIGSLLSTDDVTVMSLDRS